MSELPIACTLGAGDAAARCDRWLALAGDALVDKAATEAGVRLRYAATDRVEGELRELAAAERECCAFASWDVTRTPEALVLDVGAAPDAVPAVRAMFDLG